MPRYFFDITDGGAQRDDDGVECGGEEDVCRAALQALPDIARQEILREGARRFFTVIARDEAGNAIYTATLSIVGLWLNRRPEPSPLDEGADGLTGSPAPPRSAGPGSSG